MSSAPFIAVNAEAILRRHGLTSFAALWDLDAELVDEPNRARGGISRVSRLRLADEQGQEQVFYLKRQSNYLIRTLRHPLGQSTVAREFQNIKDRKSTRLNSSHVRISYAVFCLKKKKKI